MQSLGAERPLRFIRLNLKVGQLVLKPTTDGGEERETDFLMNAKLFYNLEVKNENTNDSASNWKMATSKNRALLDQANHHQELHSQRSQRSRQLSILSKEEVIMSQQLKNANSTLSNAIAKGETKSRQSTSVLSKDRTTVTSSLRYIQKERGASSSHTTVMSRRAISQGRIINPQALLSQNRLHTQVNDEPDHSALNTFLAAN